MVELLTSFEGRIRRGQYWLGILIIVIAAIVLGIVVGAIFGEGFFGRLLMLLITLGLLYPAVALGTKRLADRGQPPLPKLAIFFTPGVLLTVIDTFRIGYRPMQGLPGSEGMMMVPGTLSMILGVIALGVGIWALIELGFLKGDPEANAYGPPPA
ncbi:MAG: DUF805 domain-containing protein [Rhodobacteraceae bacterium]|nr:DUF805 domain-containing protein [Paracoccaceae bacterium]TVR45203.1 MAG: DUF805 domain-containing protein [Paracoccaceae bacterium]